MNFTLVSRAKKPCIKAHRPAPGGDGGNRLQVRHRHRHVGTPTLTKWPKRVSFSRGMVCSSEHPDLGHEQLTRWPRTEALMMPARVSRTSQPGRCRSIPPTLAAQRPPLPHISRSEPSVLEAPAEVGRRRGGGLDEDQAVGPDPQLAMEQPAGQTPSALGAWGMKRFRWSDVTRRRCASYKRGCGSSYCVGTSLVPQLRLANAIFRPSSAWTPYNSFNSQSWSFAPRWVPKQELGSARGLRGL